MLKSFKQAEPFIICLIFDTKKYILLEVIVNVWKNSSVIQFH